MKNYILQSCINSSDFIEEKLGSKYVKNRTMEFAKSFEEASPSTPIFFILSPGVNPLKDVEQLGKQLGYTEDNGNFHNVSLGQGQEIVAEDGLDEGATKGHWVILQVCSYTKKVQNFLNGYLILFSTRTSIWFASGYRLWRKN